MAQSAAKTVYGDARVESWVIAEVARKVTPDELMARHDMFHGTKKKAKKK